MIESYGSVDNLNKREYFALECLKAQLYNPNTIIYSDEQLIKDAVKNADRLIYKLANTSY